MLHVLSARTVECVIRKNHAQLLLLFFFCFNKNCMVFCGEIFQWLCTILARSLTASTFRDFVSFLKSKKKKALCLAKITTTRTQSTSGDTVYSASKEPFKSREFFFLRAGRFRSWNKKRKRIEANNKKELGSKPSTHLLRAITLESKKSKEC